MGSDVNESKLAEFFGKIGIIKNDKNGKPKIWLYFDKATGLPKGDATITYEDESTTTNALEWFNNTTFLGRTIAVTRADFYDWEAKKSAGGGRGGRGGRGGGGRGRY
jgi:RNA-binding protein FUS